jgi:hypothetical protein
MNPRLGLSFRKGDSGAQPPDAANGPKMKIQSIPAFGAKKPTATTTAQASTKYAQTGGQLNDAKTVLHPGAGTTAAAPGQQTITTLGGGNGHSHANNKNAAHEASVSHSQNPAIHINLHMPGHHDDSKSQKGHDHKDDESPPAYDTDDEDETSCERHVRHHAPFIKNMHVRECRSNRLFAELRCQCLISFMVALNFLTNVILGRSGRMHANPLATLGNYLNDPLQVRAFS